MLTLLYGARKNLVRFLIILVCSFITAALRVPDTGHAEADNQNRRARQVSSYQKVESALQEVNRLKGKGIESYYREVAIPEKGTWYRVFAVETHRQKQTRSHDPVKDIKSSKASDHKAAVPRNPQTKEQPAVPTQMAKEEKPAAPALNSNVKEPVRPAQQPNLAKPAYSVVKDVSGKSPTTSRKNVLPEGKNKTSEPPVNSAISNGATAAPAPGRPALPEYDSAKAEFEARRYEGAAALLSSLLAKKQGDAIQYENSVRLLADCYYFLSAGGNRQYASQAAEAYRTILRYYPDVRRGNDSAHFRLADSLERMGNDEEAYGAYSNIIAKYPDSPYRQDALYRMGRILYLTKRYAHAIDKLKNYLTAYPDGPSAFPASFLLGYCLRKANLKTEGDAAYQNALKRWNDFEALPADVLYDLGLHLFSQRDFPKAAQVFTLYLNFYPEGGLRRSALYDLGRSYYFYHSFSSALKVFSLLLESYPETLEANESILFMANIGVMEPKTEFNDCLTGRDFFRNPIETYDEMRARYPGGSLEEWLLYQKGYALWKAGRHRDSLDLYCSLLDAFPHGRLQEGSRGYLALNAKRLVEECYGKGDLPAVADLYYKVRNKIYLSPETTDMFFKIGDSLWKMGLRSDAVALLDRLKQSGRNPAQQAIADLIMMEITYSSGEMTEEKWNALLREFAKNNGTGANRARRNLADYFYRNGRYDKAAPLYEALLKDGGHPDFLAVARNHAHALRNSKSYSSAVNRYQDLISRCKANPQACNENFVADAYAGLGDCYYETADYERDLAMYQQALPGIKDKESRMWTLFRMGQSYRKRNDSAMAGKTFAELKTKSGDAFWSKVADYWVADEDWSKKNSEYLKKN